MALTNYYALRPRFKAGRGEISYTSTVTSAPGAAYGSWAPGEYCIAVFSSSGTADPTGVASNGISFTKAIGANGQSIWWALNNTVNTFAIVAPTATYTVAVRVLVESVIVTNVSAMGVGAGTSGTAVAITGTAGCGTVTPGASKQGLIVGIGAMKTAAGGAGVPSPVSGVPASLGGWVGSGAFTVAGFRMGTIIAATQDEFVDNSRTLDFRFMFAGSPGTWDYASVMFYFTGTQIALDDLTYKYSETGALLNNPSNALPIYDIDDVDGLDDLVVGTDTSPVDGANGSYVQGKFLEGKTIILEGSIIASPPLDQTLIDNLKASIAPNGNNVLGNFYYKPTTQNPRMVENCILDTFKSPIDKDVRVSQIPLQLQFLSSEGQSVDLDYSTAVILNSGSITPSGNKEISPIIYFNFDATNDAGDGPGYIKLFNKTWYAYYNNTTTDKTLVNFGVTGTGSPGIQIDISKLIAAQGSLRYGLYKLDMRNRILWYLSAGNPVDVSGALITRAWWTLFPNMANDLLFLRGAGFADSFVVAYRNTWY